MSRPSKAQREFVATGKCENPDKPDCKGKPMFGYYGTMYCLGCWEALPPERKVKRPPPSGGD